MGASACRPLQAQPPLLPFIAWGPEKLDSFLAYMSGVTTKSVRISKWQVLEFTGMQHLEDVNLLFSLLCDDAPGAQDCVNAMQLSAVLVLCNHHVRFRQKMVQCLKLFDWSGKDSLSMADVALLLKVCDAVLSRCCASPSPKTTQSQKVTVGELCKKVFQETDSISHSRLIDFFLREEAVKNLLEDLGSPGSPQRVTRQATLTRMASQRSLPGDSAYGSSQEKRPPEVEEDPAELVCPSEDSLGMTKTMQSQRSDGRPDALQEEDQGGEEDDGDRGDSKDEAVPLRPEVSLPSGFASQEGRKASKTSKAGESLEDFIKSITSCLAERSSKLKKHCEWQMQAADEDSMQSSWRFVQGALLPVAHSSGPSAVAELKEAVYMPRQPVEGRSHSGGSSGAVALALRHRAWLREALFHEDIRFNTTLAARRFVAASRPLKDARAKVVEQLQGLVNGLATSASTVQPVITIGGAAERALVDNLREMKAFAEEARSRALHELDSLSDKCERPAAALQRDLSRLDGAAMFTEILRAHGDVYTLQQVESLKASIKTLYGELSSALNGVDQEWVTLQTRFLEFLEAQEAVAAVDYILEQPGDKRQAVQRCCEQLKGLEAAAVADEVDSHSVVDFYMVQERRWYHCEGALAAQRALARRNDFRLEFWLQQARQEFRSHLRRLRLSDAMVKGGVAPHLAVLSCGDFLGRLLPKEQLKHLQTRRLVLLALLSSLISAERTCEGRPEEVKLSDIIGEVTKVTLQSGPGGTNAQKLSAKSGTDGVDPAALAHLRNLKFEDRVLAAAIKVAQSLGEGGTDVLAERLFEDYESSQHILAGVENSDVFLRKAAVKWKSVVDEELKATMHAATLDAAITHVTDKLSCLRALLPPVTEGVTMASKEDGDDIRRSVLGLAPLNVPSLTMGEVFMTTPKLTAALPEKAAEGLGVGAHAQLARLVGINLALELMREGAGSPEKSTEQFAVLKHCMRMKVDGRMLQAWAEHRMGGISSELRKLQGDEPSDSPGRPRGQSADDMRNPKRNLVLSTAQSLFKACCIVDCSQMFKKCRTQKTLKPVAPLIGTLLSELEAFAEDPNLLVEAWPLPAPPIPSMCSWLRTDGDNSDAPFSGDVCERCFALAQIACGQLPRPKSDMKESESVLLSRFAIALRVWIWARMQKAAGAAMLREGAPKAITILAPRRSALRFMEVIWREEVQHARLAEHAEGRMTALRTATRFLAPLTTSDRQLLDDEDVAVHVEEVQASLGQSLAMDMEGHLRGLAASIDEESKKDACVETGASAGAMALKEAGLAVNSVALAPVAIAAKASLRDLLSASGQNMAAKSVSDFAGLCGTLRGLDVLKVTSHFKEA
eukprot:TRINITY_DN70214_c0_g2_i1.p1 TRINITY_DN70214_c0_g2~~TRINITY_DN70214_c0_g2_i1.p1  ORF type:complete len:1350 (-),score=317.35 TRINITY_DN70214_c0_g2_i1:82-4131(-)